MHRRLPRSMPWLIGALCALAAPWAPAQDQATLDRTQILGNRELPKVLTIVPWRKAPPGELAARPAGGVLDEALAPIDREVFRRQIAFDAQWRSAAAAVPAPTPSLAPTMAPAVAPPAVPTAANRPPPVR